MHCDGYWRQARANPATVEGETMAKRKPWVCEICGKPGHVRLCAKCLRKFEIKEDKKAARP